MKTTIPIEIFPIEDDGYHLKVTILINGITANLILDTGASRTVFDETRIACFVAQENIEAHDRLSTGLGTNTMESKKVILDKIAVGAIKITNYQAAVLDLSHVNQSYEKLDIQAVDGVLGSDILVGYNAVIDYEQKELRLG
ncbi:MAG: retropepsin-like aspartic protease [Vicingaceae bacterium]